MYSIKKKKILQHFEKNCNTNVKGGLRDQEIDKMLDLRPHNFQC